MRSLHIGIDMVVAGSFSASGLNGQTRQNARIEHDRALERVITDLVLDHSELFKQLTFWR